METERLFVRRFAADDGPDLYEYLSDEQVVVFEPYGVFSREEAQREAERRAGDESFWAVCLRENEKLIGNVYLGRQEPPEFDTWELGFVFNRQYGGQGYATEAARRMLAYAFEECNAHRVTAGCNPENVKSWRLLERLGLRREGHFRKKVWFKRDAAGHPLWHDAYEYAMLREEWQGI